MPEPHFAVIGVHSTSLSLESVRLLISLETLIDYKIRGLGYRIGMLRIDEKSQLILFQVLRGWDVNLKLAEPVSRVLEKPDEVSEEIYFRALFLGSSC